VEIFKDKHGDLAESLSPHKVSFSHQPYVQQSSELTQLLSDETAFGSVLGTDYEETVFRQNLVRVYEVLAKNKLTIPEKTKKYGISVKNRVFG
jgi:hypothetical protein